MDRLDMLNQELTSQSENAWAERLLQIGLDIDRDFMQQCAEMLLTGAGVTGLTLIVRAQTLKKALPFKERVLDVYHCDLSVLHHHQRFKMDCLHLAWFVLNTIPPGMEQMVYDGLAQDHEQE